MLLVSCVGLLTLTGCFGVDGQFKHLRDTVFAGTGVEYTVKSEIGLGSFVLGFARRIVSMSDDDDAEVAQDFLREIKGVQIGSYNLHHFDLPRDRVRSKALEIIAYMEENHYDSIIRNYEHGGANLVMVRVNPDNPEKVSDFVVLNFDKHELNIVQLRGDLAKMVDIAAREGDVPGVEEAIEENRSQ